LTALPIAVSLSVFAVLLRLIFNRAVEVICVGALVRLRR